MDTYKNILEQAKELGSILRKQKLKIACAESCTGGLLSSIITEIPGSSDYFERGYVTYSNKSKIEMLGVNAKTIEKYGAVSFECAKEMVERLKSITNCQVCVSITGIAGPGGGSLEKPVGLVYTGFYIKKSIFVEKNFFYGTRHDIRLKTANFVINYLLKKFDIEE